jgi:Fuc2NAc and GlcNAc transferase
VFLVVAVYLLWAWQSGWLTPRVVLALGVGGAAVAATGWVDDVRSLSAGPRLAVHFAAAIWALVLLGGLPSIQLGDTTVTLGKFGFVIAMLAIVWSTNLFNFMDGIDGIAGAETVCMALFGGVLLIRKDAIGLAGFELALAGAMLGFLAWNWHPAKIFLGDVGSGFVGFSLATAAVASENSRAVPAVLWIILGSVFLVDATLTLLSRIRRGYWHQAHKDHVYQRAVQAGFSHSQVSLLVVLINVILGALALLAARNRLAPGAALLIGLGVCALVYVAARRSFSAGGTTPRMSSMRGR